MMSWPESIQRLCIIGTGLIGGSLALALKETGYSGHIVGCARSQDTADKALKLGVVDSATTDCVAAVQGADLVVLAVPMKGMKGILQQIQPHLGEHTIVTDGGSVKGSFIDEASSILGTMKRVVPGHPIAGKEYSGVDAAVATLYREHLVIVTPTDETDADAIACVTSMWEQSGARVEVLAADHHDRVLGATSHLPHVIAFTIVDMLSEHQSREEVFRYSAGGFRDFTRIASGDPVMWRDICLTNRLAIDEVLCKVIERLQGTRELIAQGDGDALEAIFLNSKQTRDALIARYERERAAQNNSQSEVAEATSGNLGGNSTGNQLPESGESG